MPATLPVRLPMPVLRQVADPDAVRAETVDETISARMSQPIDGLLEQRKQFLRFLERRVSSPALAEDILQNAYLRALEKAGELRDHESSTAWFYRILRNAVIDFYRHRSVEDRSMEQWASELETEVQPNDLTQDIVCGCIANVLPALKPSYAEILREIDLEQGDFDATLKSFAERHRISVPNATVRIHRARKALKQRLIVTCGSCATHGCLNCTCPLMLPLLEHRRSRKADALLTRSTAS